MINNNFKFLKLFDKSGGFIVISLVKYFMFRKTILSNDFFYTLINYFYNFDKNIQSLIIKEINSNIYKYDNYLKERFDFFLNKRGK